MDPIPGYDDDGMMDTQASPRLHFSVVDGVLYYQVVTWWERPAGSDSHVVGRSRWIYGEKVPVKALYLDDEYPEVVLDHINGLLPPGFVPVGEQSDASATEDLDHFSTYERSIGRS